MGILFSVCLAIVLITYLFGLKVIKLNKFHPLTGDEFIWTKTGLLVEVVEILANDKVLVTATNGTTYRVWAYELEEIHDLSDVR